MSEASSKRSETVMAAVRWAMLVMVTAVAGASVYRAWGPVPERAGEATRGPRYHCPMHPEITSTTPGECPICHMALVEIADDRTHTNHPPESPRDGGVEAVVPVMLTLDRQQLGGVVSEPARRGGGRGELRVPAVVEAPESARAEVRVRATGFVERVAVRETGTTVTRGQVLAWVYSPQVFQAAQELLTAQRWQGQPGGTRSNDVAAAARQSLELMGVAPADIDAMVASGQPARALPLRAPAAGTVLRTAAIPGTYATPETLLYELADLSRVWAVASVWERDLSRVRPGATVRFVSASASVSARVLLVEPSVSAEARAARVRVELANPGMTLRPGMLGEVIVEDSTDAGVGTLTIARDAVIDTGRTRYVFVQTGDAAFEPRTVRTGVLIDDRWEVLDGLTEGERVVSRGTFMIDSESRLRAALSAGSAR